MNKQMEELKEEFIDWLQDPNAFPPTSVQVADWWIAKLHSQREQDAREIEGMKLLEVAFSSQRLREKQMYNYAIDKVLTVLRNKE